MGCRLINRLIINFPGLLEDNVLHSKDHKEELYEVTFKNENKYPVFKSVKMKISDHQLRENGRTSQSSKPEYQAVLRIAIQVRGWDNEVKLVIEQVQQNEFSVDIDISSGDNLADNDKQTFVPAVDDEPVREEVPVDCNSYKTKICQTGKVSFDA